MSNITRKLKISKEILSLQLQKSTIETYIARYFPILSKEEIEASYREVDELDERIKVLKEERKQL